MTPQPLFPTRRNDLVLSADDAQSVLGRIVGVLELLERQSETSEDAFNAFCLLCLVRGQLEDVLEVAD